MTHIMKYKVMSKNQKVLNYYKDVRQSLKYLWLRYTESYVALFLKGELLFKSIFKQNKCFSNMLNTLLKYNILEENGGHKDAIKSKYLIYPLGNCFIITDFHNVVDLDRVFPIFQENVYLSEKLKTPKEGTVLDIGFGSGIFSIMSAVNGASMAYGTDINPKTIKYGKLNACINGVEEKVKFFIGDVYDPLPKHQDLKFDLVCTNPPFLPIPSNIKYFMHSNGGPDGTDVIRKILNGLKGRIAPDGRFQMIVVSLGDSSKSTLVGTIAKEILANQKASISISILTEPLLLAEYAANLRKKIPKGENFDNVEIDEEIMKWQDYQKTQRWTHLYYLYIEINFNRKFFFSVDTDFNETGKLREDLNKKLGVLNGIQWRSE